MNAFKAIARLVARTADTETLFMALEIADRRFDLAPMARERWESAKAEADRLADDLWVRGLLLRDVTALRQESDSARKRVVDARWEYLQTIKRLILADFDPHA